MVTHRLSFITGLSTNDWLSCDFEANNSCEWIDDANNWLVNWRPTSRVIKEGRMKGKHQSVLCTQINSRTRSRLRNRLGHSSVALKNNLVVRIISPPVTTLDNYKCLKLNYLFENMPQSSSNGFSLNLLRRSEGNLEDLCEVFYFNLIAYNGNHHRSVEPIHHCSFEHNLCGWTNDQSSWEGHWELTMLKTPSTNASCFRINQKSPLSLKNTWSVKRKTSLLDKPTATVNPNRLISAKLWSPLIQPDDQLHCLVLTYKIDIIPSVVTSKIG
ncbi:unnamed protein product, partial [Trichobilharzia regenti]